MGDLSATMNSQRKTPVLDRSAIEDLMSRHYGLSLLNYQELNSYDDRNFKVTVTDDVTNQNVHEKCRHGYVLKVLNYCDSRNTSVIEGQFAMMSRVRDRGILTPRAVPTLSNRLYLTTVLPGHPLAADPDAAKPEPSYVVRLFEYIPGSILTSVPLTPGLCYKVGTLAGRLDTALKGFQHSSLRDNHLRWHLDSIPQLRDVTDVVTDNADRKLVEEIFTEFQSHVLDHVQELQQGMIHSDFNTDNILVAKLDHADLWADDHDVSAILDYGDCAHGPYIFEIAIAMTYMAISNSSHLDPQAASGYALAGYLSQVSLTDKEMSLIQLCMCARIAQSLVIGAHSYIVDPSNDYVLDTAAKGWPTLRHLRDAVPSHVLSGWTAIAAECKETLNQV